MDAARMPEMEGAAMAAMARTARAERRTGRKKTEQRVHKTDNVPVTSVTIPAFLVHHPFMRGQRHVHLALLGFSSSGLNQAPDRY
jgi:hypothetical protein